jgi:precorrin-2 C(20)-methyltransferase
MIRMGHFWAIGVGPGDPELLTVKAINLLGRADVIYHAGPAPDRGRAVDIIRGHLRPQQERRVVLTASMQEVSSDASRSHYRPAVEQIADECRRGRNVAFVTEGDPTLYSTAAHIWQLLAEMAPEIPIEVVPGVSSITAAAARVGWPLAQKDEVFTVVPAGYHRQHLDRLLTASGNVCLLKVSSAIPELLEAIEALRARGMAVEAAYIEELGTEREWITHDLRQATGRRNYFSLALIRASSLARSASEGESVPSLALRASQERTGAVWIVGIGPGDPDLLSQRVWKLLHSAEDIVGYDGYLKQLEPLGLSACLHNSPIGDELRRAERALELARQGRRVVVVSSGDAGVYGMASLVLEAAATGPEIPIEVVPGITAALSAAARLGAPLGHDFACISLSDLLTPWPVIEDRLETAGRGDFVVVLYNPISQRRGWQLLRARDILRRHRGPETPVGLVSRAYRNGQEIRLTTLGELTAEGVSMQTTVIVGSSRTRMVQGRMVTPRGYDLASGGHDLQASPVETSLGTRPPLAERILQESFALIERELGPHTLPPWAFAVVRRMIHASADFEFAQTLRYSPDFEAALRAALRDRLPIITDTEMVLQGIRTALAGFVELTLACHLNDPTARALVETDGLTRSAAGIRLAFQRHRRPLLVIGNAPTALDEALRLVQEEGWRPAAIIGMPVGFVGVLEAKSRLLAQTVMPYLTCMGRKGGSAVAAAALNALVEWCNQT